MDASTGPGRSPAEFREIVLDGFGSVHFQQSSVTSISVEGQAGSALPPGAEIRNGVLYIDSSGASNSFVFFRHPAKYRVTGPHLERLTIEGAAKATVTGLHDRRLTVAVEGAGSVTLSGVALETLVVRIGGAGKISATGSAASQDIEISGTGSFNGDELPGQRAEVNIQGAGRARINVRDSLDVSIGGVGNVTYLGDPAVRQQIAGLGRVKRADGAPPPPPPPPPPDPPL